jgi:hypothetical protein
MSTLTDKEIAKIVDEMAELQRRFKPMVDKFEKLKKQLATVVNDDESDEVVYLTSDKNYIEYSKPAYNLVCKVGAEKFLEETQCYDAITISVAVAREQLDRLLLEELFESKRGSRRLLKITPIVETVLDELDDDDYNDLSNYTRRL